MESLFINLVPQFTDSELQYHKRLFEKQLSELTDYLKLKYPATEAAWNDGLKRVQAEIEKRKILVTV